MFALSTEAQSAKSRQKASTIAPILRIKWLTEFFHKDNKHWHRYTHNLHDSMCTDVSMPGNKLSLSKSFCQFRNYSCIYLILTVNNDRLLVSFCFVFIFF